MLFALMLLICFFVITFNSTALHYIPEYAVLLFFLITPLCHLVQIERSQKEQNAALVVRVLPFSQVMRPKKENILGLALCYTIFIIYAGTILAAIGNMIPQKIGGFLAQNGHVAFLLLVVIYLIFSYKKISLAPDILFTSLLIMLYTVIHIITISSYREAVWYALFPAIIKWLFLTIIYLAVIMIYYRTYKIKFNKKIEE